MDPDTDAKIQVAIRTVFKRSTVITVAHRIGTIIDADFVLVRRGVVCSLMRAACNANSPLHLSVGIDFALLHSLV